MQNLTLPGPAIGSAIDITSKAGERLANQILAAQSSQSSDRLDELKKTAQEFESLFISHLLKVMRETIEESGLTDDGGFGKSIYTELFDQELSRSVARRGALGIADLLYKRLAPEVAADPETATPKGESGPISSKVAPAPQFQNETAAERSAAEVPDFRLPVKAPISSDYGMRKDPFTGQKSFHRGIDLAVPAGTQVLAPWSGRVVSVGSQAGYGNYVVVEHPEGFQTLYAHLGSASVRKGDSVTAGEALGTVGSSGRSTGPHLHFEVIRNGNRIDPKAVLAE